MKNIYKYLILSILALFTLAQILTVQADTILEYGYTPLEESTKPNQMIYVGETGQLLPKQDSLIKNFRYAYKYTVDNPVSFSIREDGSWTALSPGKVQLKLTMNYSDQRFKDEMIANGLVWSSRESTSVLGLGETFNIQVLPATSPVYRLYHAGLKVHLYTTDANENSVLATRGWRQEGTAWTTSNAAGDPVYRLYHAGLKVHLYTKDANEYKVLASRGWRQESVAYRSSGTVPVYRLYHKGIKKHLYTKDVNEKNILSTRGWRQEGLAWYVD